MACKQPETPYKWVDVVWVLIKLSFQKQAEGLIWSARYHLLTPVALHRSVCVAQSCLTLWDPMDCSTPGLPVSHCLPALAHCPFAHHVHWIGDAIQSSHPLPLSSPYAFRYFGHLMASLLIGKDPDARQDWRQICVGWLIYMLTICGPLVNKRYK